MKNSLRLISVYIFAICLLPLTSCANDDSDAGSDDDGGATQRSASYSIVVNGNGLSNATVEGTVVDDATSFYLDDVDPDILNFTMADDANNTSIVAGFTVVGEVSQEYPFMEMSNGRVSNLLINSEFSGTLYTFVSENIGSATITNVMLEGTVTEDGFLVRELQVLFVGEFVNTQDSLTYNIAGSFSFLDE